ncbi:MAG: hypothetical protein LBD89_01825 [Tannerellaceae bacterium]|jgi:hypothetical protein|nr:hypothetical protein [Tannerellaceae bacterium]
MKYMKYPPLVLFLLLLSFQMLSAQTPAELKSWLPSVAEWTLAEETEVFNPDNLFDRINGAAPLFIENNFREMTAVDYKKGEDYITIQAYRHATAEDAFGMYASERSTELTHLPGIGGEAQGDQENLFFFAGNIYVKMSSHSETEVKEILANIARGLASQIDPQAGYPVILKAFPAKGKQPYSETYITSSYIGHEFLKSVYTATYEAEGKTFQLFVVDAHSEEQAGEVLRQYFAFTKQPMEPLLESKFLIKDRYNGEIPLIRKGPYLIGIYSENGETIPQANTLLQEVADKL